MWLYHSSIKNEQIKVSLVYRDAKGWKSVQGK